MSQLECSLVGRESIYSREGATKGDPLAMAIFAIAIQPLIDRLAARAKATQVWLTDDAASFEREYSDSMK